MLLDWALRGLSIVLALGTPLALWYRFWWGGKSQIAFRQLPDPRERYWSYGRTDGEEFWSNYVHIIAINKGWWTGLIWNFELREVSFRDGPTVTDTSEQTVKIEIDTYTDGESKRIDLGNPHQRVERNIPGRDIAHLKLAPFLSPDGDLAQHAEKSKIADLTFEATIQDNNRTDSVPFTVTMDVSNVNFEE